MWQRIQTIYFLGALACFAGVSFSPLFYREYSSANESVTQYATHLHYFRNVEKFENSSDQPTLIVVLLMVFVLLGCGAVLFLFNNRKLQIKVSGWVFIGQLLFLGTAFGYWFLSLNSDIEKNRTVALTTNHPHIGMYLGLLGLVLLFLGRKNVKKDEALVRSVDRIR